MTPTNQKPLIEFYLDCLRWKNPEYFTLERASEINDKVYDPAY